MLYNYSLLVAENNNRKRKKIILIILSIILIIISILCGIICAKNYKMQQYAKLIEEESKIIKEQERIAEEQERIRLKNSRPLTEEQMQAIENIYSQEEKSVFLTFDDGPTTSVTPFILDLLKQENIKATFFVLGNRAKANPELIKREFEEGHYIANHGYTHRYSTIYKNSQTVLDEYNYTESCIQEALGNPDYHSRVFRFPGGSVGGYYNSIKKEAKAYLRQNNIASLDWNALTNDAAGARTKEALLENAINTIRDKKSVVILMHDSSDKILTYETLPDLIKYLRDNGYTFKTLYDII